jgi:hypothetical protein
MAFFVEKPRICALNHFFDKNLLLLFLLPAAFGGLVQGPKVLLATAHPDDEMMFPVTVM